MISLIDESITKGKLDENRGRKAMGLLSISPISITIARLLIGTGPYPLSASLLTAGAFVLLTHQKKLLPVL